MRTTIAIASFLTVAAGAVGANALSGMTAMKGSDTLYDVTLDVIAFHNANHVPPAAQITSVYVGGGSGGGQTLIQAGTAQTVAPMSRALNNGICAVALTATAGAPSLQTAEGMVVGLDGLSIVGSITTSASPACNGTVDAVDGLCPAADSSVGLASTKAIAYTDAAGVAQTYTLTNWTDALRIVYGGATMAAGSNIALRDCNSPLRRALVDNWGNLFANGCTGTACTQLRHAFRRDDSSGTTDVFNTLIGLSAVNLTSRANPFCNTLASGSTAPAMGLYAPDFQDNDPIRRTCAGTNSGNPVPTTTATEQVCSRLGNLGVVLPIPAVDNIVGGVAAAYPTTPCATGQFKLGSAPRTATGVVVKCPNGDSAVFSVQCLVPTDASGNAGCLNGRGNRPSYISTNVAIDGMLPGSAVMDGRTYNLHLYKADGTYQTDIRNRPISGSFHRIHSTRTLNLPDTSVNGCTQLNATEQIGCLAQASPCSIGYAGREAAVYPVGGTALVGGIKVAGREPSIDCIEKLDYVITRKLYLNTMIGFENVTGDESEILQDYTNPAVINPIMTARGFIPVPAPVQTYCEDINEMTLCPTLGLTTNVDACANNAAPIPGSPECGNGVVEAAEACDAGLKNLPLSATAPSGGCKIDCTLIP